MRAIHPILLALAVPLSMMSATCALAADTKVACVGNSITYGYGLDLQYLQNYPLQLDSLLGPGYAVTNFGVSGKTMIKAVGDAYWKQTAFGDALASLPDQVVIELGTNDSKDYIWPWYKQDFKADYLSMIDTFRSLQSLPQVWVTLQPPANNPLWNMYDTTIVRQVNPLILEAALNAATPVIDLRMAMSGHPGWFQSDSVHPNATGAKELARIIAAMLQRAPVSFTQAAGQLTATKGWGYQWYRNDTALAGATARSLVATHPGNYKVSVKIDSLGGSRLVSAAQAAAGTSSIGAKREMPPLRIRFAAAGGIETLTGNPVAPGSIQLWNGRGEPVEAADSKPGIHFYRLLDTRTLGAPLSSQGTILRP